MNDNLQFSAGETKMEKMLQNQVALITGGTAGIGKEIALKFAEQGAKVIVFGGNVERGQQVVAAIDSMKGPNKAEFYQVDASKKSEVEKAIKDILEKHSHVDILVNNAGISKDQLFMKMSEEDWDTVLDVNLKSCYNTIQCLTRSMLKARQGCIINMSSVVGLNGNIGQAHYAASKAGMIGLTKSLAKEFAARNIRVNCIAPGFIETPMTQALPSARVEEIKKVIPMGKFGNTADIANAALFLASTMGAYITGQTLVVDGGMSM